jgi:tRNA (adenine57-N1/adenine58-N1)-methyltransferase
VDVAREGDLVLLISKDYKRYLITLRAGARMQTHRGMIGHDDLIGQPLGRQVRSHLDHAFLVLEPSTGAVQPTGHIYSYEQQPDIQRVAQENVRKLGLGEQVTFRLRDIAEGFDEEEIDSLFLDVRDPWSYLAQAHAALKGGGFFGAIVPTANQVAHLLNDLQRSGFSALEVEELILRPYKAVPARLRPMARIVAHTGYLIFARKVLGEMDGDWFTRSRGRARAAERGSLDDYW